MKGGTTSLNIALSRGEEAFTVKVNTKKKTFEYNPDLNPNIFTGGMKALNHKEMDFFSKEKNYKHGINTYKKFFNPQQLPFCNDKPTLIGECSPSYFTLEESKGNIIERIQKHLPEVKIILSLRDPITRTYSQYIHMIRDNWGYDNLYKNKSFKEAVLGKWNHKTPNYILTRSFYYKNLLKYKSAFKDRLFVTTQERLLNNQKEELDKLYDFLGSKNLPFEKQFSANRNIDYNSNYSISNMDNEIKEYLKELFKKDVHATQELLPEVDFNYWNKY